MELPVTKLIRRGVRNPKGIPKFLLTRFPIEGSGIEPYLRAISYRFPRTVEQSLDGWGSWVLKTPRVPDFWTFHDFFGSCHEPIVTRLILESVSQDTVFWDIGSHIGHFPVAVLSQTDIDPSNTHLFDPDPLNTRILRHNVKRFHGGESVKINQLNVGDTNGGNVVTGDEYASLHGFPDIVKIDAGPASGNGNEDAVLAGMGNVLSQGQPELIFEIHFNVSDYTSHRKSIITTLAQHISPDDYEIHLYEDHHMFEDSRKVDSLQALPKSGDGDLLIHCKPM